LEAGPGDCDCTLLASESLPCVLAAVARDRREVLLLCAQTGRLRARLRPDPVAGARIHCISAGATPHDRLAVVLESGDVVIYGEACHVAF
jgi:hypothetical protein